MKNVASIIQLQSLQERVCHAAEMYHCASLMHDDVIDHAETRRGRKSINSTYGQIASVNAGVYSMILGLNKSATIQNSEVRSVNL